jgi:hypothetical protein
MFYLLKNLLLLIMVIFKLKCNNLIFNEIMVLNASYVCLHAFSLRRESPDSDPGRLMGSTVGSFADQPSARSPVIESTIEQTNTCLVGLAGTQKPHRNTQFTHTSTRRKMNSVLDGDERRGAYAPIS